jgi:Tol biopolymer transport system component
VNGQPFTIAEHVGASTNGQGAFSISRVSTLAYATGLSESGSLTWFDRNGNRIRSVGAEGDYPDFSLSPNEKFLAASRVDPKTSNPDIWMFDLQRGGEYPFTFGPRLNSAPVWSPDGRSVAFRTTRSNNASVEFYQKNLGNDGNGSLLLAEEVQRSAGGQSINLSLTDWSPDGLLYSLTTTLGSDLWILPLSANAKPAPYLTSRSDKLHANFSPDRTFIAYSTNESGRFEVRAQSFPRPDQTWYVSTNGGYEPRFRADGRELYYLTEDGKLMVVSVNPGPKFEVPKLLFPTQVPEGVHFYRTHYVPRGDGQQFLINTRTADSPPVPITVVLNWTTGLKRN